MNEYSNRKIIIKTMKYVQADMTDDTKLPNVVDNKTVN